MNSVYETKPHGIMFHHFHDADHPVGQGSISAEQFADVIRYVGHDRILPAKEWMRRALDNTLRKGDLCITFDDNLRCQYDIAYPVLRELGITAFWFVYTSVIQGIPSQLEIFRYYRSTQFATVDEFYASFFELVIAGEHRTEVLDALSGFDPVNYMSDFPFYTTNDRKFRFLRDSVLGPDRYNEAMDRMIGSSGFDVPRAAEKLWMDDQRIRQLHGDDHVIGLHSFSHPMQLGSMSRSEQEFQYSSNHGDLTRVLGEKPLSMSHPCNSYNLETLDVLRRLGVRLGFRANMVESVAFGDLEFPREDHANVLRQMRATEA